MTHDYNTTAVLVSRIRAKLPPGSKVVVVNQQREPQLQRDLEDLFGWKLLWYSLGNHSGSRKIDAAVTAIRYGNYNLVLGSTGLFAHKYDRMLSTACTSAGVSYVRVNKGRVGITIVAIARSLGLL